MGKLKQPRCYSSNLMESHVASSKIHLLKALEFSGSKVAPYILSRQNVSTHTSGASIYGAGSAGSRVARFEISASAGAMIDLSTLVISATVHNLAAAPTTNVADGALKFLSPSLSGCLSSARVSIGGVEASSCD